MPTTRMEKLMEMLASLCRTLREEANRGTQVLQEDMTAQVDALTMRIAALEGNACVEMQVTQAASGDGAIPSLKSAKVVKPSSYDGQILWEEYDTQFTIAAKVNKWTSAESAGILATMHRGSAVSVLMSLRDNERMDLECLRNALSIRFGSKGMSQLHYVQFRNRMQNPQEDLATLAVDIERLGRQAFAEYPVDMQDRVFSEQFIHAIADIDIKERVMLEKSKSIREAVLKATEIEAIRESVQNTRRVRGATMEETKILERLEAIEKHLSVADRTLNNNRYRNDAGSSPRRC